MMDYVPLLICTIRGGAGRPIVVWDSQFESMQ